MHFLHHTPDLSATGGSRNILDLSSYLCDRGHRVSIFIDADRIAFDIDPRVEIFLLKKGKLTPLSDTIQKSSISKYKEKRKAKKIKKRTALKIWFRKVQNIKRYFIKLLAFPFNYYAVNNYINSQGVDLITTHNMYTFFEHFFYYPKSKFTLMLRNSPNEVFFDRGIVRLLPLKAYLSNRRCLGVSQATIDEVNGLSLGVKENSFAIYNPFDFSSIRKSANSQPDSSYDINNRYIISLSSLDKRKRIDRTIHALYQSEDKEIDLVLVGTGPMKSELIELAKSLGLSDRVHFLGFHDNPYPLIKNAEMLILASDSEGLPTVLIESLICGTPVIATDCPCGPNEILINDLERYLVPMIGVDEALIQKNIAKNIDYIIRHDVQIEEHHILRFSKESVVDNWIKVAEGAQ